MSCETTYKEYTADNLPDEVLALDSKQGQLLLENSDCVNKKMIEGFTKQENNTYCGPASLALLLNSLNLSYHVKFQSVKRQSEDEQKLMDDMANGTVLISENDIVNSPNAADFIKSTKLESAGMTLSELATLAMCCGLGVNTYFAYTDQIKLPEDKQKELFEREKHGDEYIIRSVHEFRDTATRYLKRPLTGLIVNYDMATLNYELPFGHFSPVAAYNEESDRFLVMDVWPGCLPVWITATSLFNSLATVDNDSELPRGLVHIHELL